MWRLEVVLSETAIDDLQQISDFIVENGASDRTASRFIARIKERCISIGDDPHSGRSRDDLFPNLRTMPFQRRAMIAYLVETDRVVVTNVFYGGRDFETTFRILVDEDQRP